MDSGAYRSPYFLRSSVSRLPDSSSLEPENTTSIVGSSVPPQRSTGRYWLRSSGSIPDESMNSHFSGSVHFSSRRRHDQRRFPLSAGPSVPTRNSSRRTPFSVHSSSNRGSSRTNGVNRRNNLRRWGGSSRQPHRISDIERRLMTPIILPLSVILPSSSSAESSRRPDSPLPPVEAYDRDMADNVIFFMDMDLARSNQRSRGNSSSTSTTQPPPSTRSFVNRPNLFRRMSELRLSVRLLQESVRQWRQYSERPVHGFRGFGPSEISGVGVSAPQIEFSTPPLPQTPTTPPLTPIIKRTITGPPAKDCQRLKLAQELTVGVAVCVICTDIMDSKEPIWGCNSCFNVFHLKCIRRWAKISRGAVPEGNWICPVCRRPKYVSPNRIHYRCFCGRVPKPKPIKGVTPHACGSNCIRGCGIACHPGPCPGFFSETSIH